MSVKVKIVGKLRDQNNNVTGYVIKDLKGNRQSFSCQQLEYLIKIESITIDSCVTSYKSWDTWYKLLWEAVRAGEEITNNFVDNNGNKVGSWLANQKKLYNKNKLKDWQVDKLNELGVLSNKTSIVSKNKSSKIENSAREREISLRIIANDNKTWDEWYRLVCNAIDSGIKVTTYTKDKEGNEIGLWVSCQRKLQKQNALSPEQVVKLSRIGIRHNKSWDEMYDLVCIALHNGMKINTNSVDGFGNKIGKWVEQQNKNRRLGKLTAEQEKKLRDAGLIREFNPKSWNDWYTLACKAADAGIILNTATVDDDGNKIGGWISAQRKAYRQRILKPEQEKKLLDLGVLQF